MTRILLLASGLLIGLGLTLFVGCGEYPGTGNGEHAFVRGDANFDGTVNLADSSFILAFIAGNRNANCLDALDVNDDGQISQDDSVYLIDFLFNGGAAIPEPTQLGFDPTQDNLRCF
ncbi:MAG: dockerin type I repeat-containing protein [Nitrosarchaeum sp.]|nr:dockerin type I repeat-containing protein [Nitrosarchaeum sp.]